MPNWPVPARRVLSPWAWSAEYPSSGNARPTSAATDASAPLRRQYQVGKPGRNREHRCCPHRDRESQQGTAPPGPGGASGLRGDGQRHRTEKCEGEERLREHVLFKGDRAPVQQDDRRSQHSGPSTPTKAKKERIHQDSRRQARQMLDRGDRQEASARQRQQVKDEGVAAGALGLEAHRAVAIGNVQVTPGVRPQERWAVRHGDEHTRRQCDRADRQQGAMRPCGPQRGMGETSDRATLGLAPWPVKRGGQRRDGQLRPARVGGSSARLHWPGQDATGRM